MQGDDKTTSSFSSKTDNRCTFKTVQTTRCYSKVDSDGQPQRKCHKILKKFRECPGLPTEVIEHFEQEIDPDGSTFTLDSPSPDFRSDSILPSLDSLFGFRSGVDHPADKRFRQKLGDYFAWAEKGNAESGRYKSQWKEFESDFQEI